MRRSIWLLSFAVFAILSCATRERIFPEGQPCVADRFVVVDSFEAARRGRCRITGPDTVTLDIVSEDETVINPSPWYALRLEPSGPVIATVELDYGSWAHRYVPKISADGLTWRPLQAVDELDGGARARFQVSLSREPVWIAAQELVPMRTIEDRYRTMAETSGAGYFAAGNSVEGRPVHLLDSNARSSDVIILVGRQHPPEVSGGIALDAFVETLFSGTALSEEFRERFRIVVIPLLNPDGIARGNWRHNADGIDLNRDWGPFTQPETRIVKSLLDEFDLRGFSPRLFLDFHSTKRNLFYTQHPDEENTMPEFTSTWDASVRSRLHDYPFTFEPRRASDTPNAKNYVYRRYGIPAMTYEVGDETERDAIRNSARVFAEEFMRLLLEST